MAKRKTQAKRSVGSEIVRRLKNFTAALEATDSLQDRFTCRTIKLDVRPQKYSAAMVKETRELLRSSQSIFAQFLGVSTSAVRDWEQGLKSPSGAVCRLMDEIRQDPQHFFERLVELSTSAAR